MQSWCQYSRGLGPGLLMITAFQNLLPPNPIASSAASARGLPTHSASPGWSFELISVPGDPVAANCSSVSSPTAPAATSRVCRSVPASSMPSSTQNPSSISSRPLRSSSTAGGAISVLIPLCYR